LEETETLGPFRIAPSAQAAAHPRIWTKNQFFGVRSRRLPGRIYKRAVKLAIYGSETKSACTMTHRNIVCF
jgi:hypothetical protein